MARGRRRHRFCGPWPIMWLDRRRLGRNMIRKLVTRKSRKGVWVDLSEQTKNVILFTSLVNAHPRATSAEEDFNDHMDRRVCSVDTSQPLFPSHSCHCPMGSRTEWQRWQGCRLCISQKLTRPTCLQPLPNVQPLRSRLDHCRFPCMAPLHGGAQPTAWWQIDYIGPLPPGRGRPLLLHE